MLGPLLFLIYINDIGALKLKSDPNVFTDDTHLFYFSSNILDNMLNGQNDLDILEEYFRLNKLTLNIDKTKFMNIHPNNISLGEVSEFKYLGIIIDKYLVRDRHIKTILNKISCRVGIIRKLSHFLPKKILLLLYYSLVHCNLEYLCMIWGSAAKHYLKQVQVLQNRCLKYIFG